MVAKEPPLVSPDWLEEHLDDPRVRIVEVTSVPDDTTYREGHIPGAVWWYWKDALWHATDRQFPTPGEMAQRLGSIGITPDTCIVIYGNPVQFGTYAFWVLTMCGHRDVRMLDGGRKGWIAQGRPLTQEVRQYAPVDYRPGVADPSSRLGRDNVLAGLGAQGRLLLDVRSPEEYWGESAGGGDPPGHGAERMGRIPGAVHLFFRELLNEDDTFKKPEELRAICAEVGATPDQSPEIVVYCRLSHRASLAWFAMRYLLGYDNARIYDGSWTEWGSIVGFPVER